MRWIVAPAVLLSFIPGLAAAQSNPVRSALPPQARLVSSLALPGQTSDWVVVYRDGSVSLGVVHVEGPTASLVWHLSVPGKVRVLRAPENSLFLAITKRSDGASVYAFVVTADGVRSAIDGHPAGRVYGDEGAVSLRDGFRVREHDGAHRGSVSYRIITEYVLNGSMYVERRAWRAPDISPGSYPTPNAVFHTSRGSTILLKLQVADTEPLRELGLMYRRTLDPDSGMAFVWPQPVEESFWMENTYLPLTVAFIGAKGRIQEMQDMQALTCDLHTPSQPYLDAIEVNRGFFTANGIKVGDIVTFDLRGASAAWATNDGAGQNSQICSAATLAG